MQTSLLKSRRGPRNSFVVGTEKGVYALFLRPGSRLPHVQAGKDGLLYIGLAANRSGLAGRCHFNARTVNHSPRKSLAVLLKAALDLNPVLVTKPNSANTWGLDEASDAKLTEWMHAHLLLAVEACDDPDALETTLIGGHAPPLNLTKCIQTPQHQFISAARHDVKSALEGFARPAAAPMRAVATSNRRVKAPDRSRAPSPGIEGGIDTAEAIAARHGLNPKNYRQRLRMEITWYLKPQTWSFPAGSRELRDMIAVAEAMSRT